MESLVAQMTPYFDCAFEDARVFLTGHTGFKGSWLTAWLHMLGASVHGFSLDPPTNPSLFESARIASLLASHTVGDVRDLQNLRAAMQEAQPSVVFHLAAQPLVRASYDDPLETYETNVIGTINVLEAARATPSVRAIVVITSDKCYENREWPLAYRENDPMGGWDPYSSSKGCAELAVNSWRRSFFASAESPGLATARAGNVIGGGDWAQDRIVPDCIRALSTRQPVIVRNPGAVRPWQHVLESLSGYLCLASHLLADGKVNGEAWNFGPLPGDSLAVGELATALVSHWGSGEWVATELEGEQPHEAGYLQIDSTKAMNALRWRPVWCAADAIEVTTRWYRSLDDGTSSADNLVRSDIDEYMHQATQRRVAWACGNRSQRG